jgi:hypothetical protein
MSVVNIYRIALALALGAALWFYFNPRERVVYEQDARVLEQNKKLQYKFDLIKVERDSLRKARVQVKEVIVYREKRFKENEKIIPTLDLRQLDSVIRAGLR